MYVYIYIYTHVYIEREREIERKRDIVRVVSRRWLFCIKIDASGYSS